MLGYLLSIVGAIVLLMVVQLILPEGKIGVSVRSILGIFLLFVILSPIIKVVNDKFSFSDVCEYEFPVF